MCWHFLLETERPCQETHACRGISISLKHHASLSLHASCPHLCKPQCAGARPSLAKRLNFEQSVRCSGKKHLSDCRKVSLFICISDSLSCTYSPCMFLVFSSCLPCNHVSECVFFFFFYFFFSFLFVSVLCLSAYIFTSAPAFLLGSLSSHPPRLTPGNATRASNRGIQQSSVKVIET